MGAFEAAGKESLAAPGAYSNEIASRRMANAQRPFLKRILDPFRPHLRPRIVVLGAQKAGTSALFKMLVMHPHILPPSEKELAFFSVDEAYSKGMGHYLERMPLRPLRPGPWTTLDATPEYLARPLVAQRIKENLGDPVLVAILRDPVRRAFSAWNMFRQFEGHPRFAHLYDARSFDQAIEDELTGRRGVVGYLKRGHYSEQLHRYFDVFGRDRILVVPYPQLRKDPRSVVDAVLQRAKLDPRLLKMDVSGVRDNVRPYSAKMSDAVGEALKAYYRPHEAALTELLGVPLDLDESR